jgi:hypothetical protein
VRSLASARPRLSSLSGLLRWAQSAGWALRETADPGTLHLIVA